MENELIICDCVAPEHNIIIQYDKGDDEVYISVTASPYLPFWKRVKHGMKYIFRRDFRKAQKLKRMENKEKEEVNLLLLVLDLNDACMDNNAETIPFSYICDGMNEYIKFYSEYVFDSDNDPGETIEEVKTTISSNVEKYKKSVVENTKTTLGYLKKIS
jgi:hypothetical protein